MKKINKFALLALLFLLLQLPCFSQSLTINTDDNQNIKSMLIDNLNRENKDINYNIPLPIKIKRKAPGFIHSLVKVNGRVNPASVNKLHSIIDLIWGDEEGRFLLRKISNNNLCINITSRAKHSNVIGIDYDFSFDRMKTPTNYRPMLLWDLLKISIRESDILSEKIKETDFYPSTLVLVHELCHAVYRLESYTTKSSQEEEFLCYMIGSNIAHKVLYERPLNKEETINQAILYYARVSESYKDLNRNDFRFFRVMNSVNIVPPNYELYSHYWEHDFGNADPCVYLNSILPKLREYLPPSQKNSSLSTKVCFIIDRNGNISNILIVNSSGNKNFDDKCIEAMKKIPTLPTPDFADSKFFIPVVYVFK
ncbi:MAG: TonB family protein [Candidatus Gastranaerophilales bacterium]|nr:TonB family protein [Candidatus Gastranaerophilales bacterium]